MSNLQMLQWRRLRLGLTIIGSISIVFLSFWATLAILDNIKFGQIHIISATYGGNQRARLGNSTALLKKACEGRTFCSYEINVGIIGDTAPGRPKQFTVEFQCGMYLPVNVITVYEEAHGKHAQLAC